jgi:hypothetical protein
MNMTFLAPVWLAVAAIAAAGIFALHLITTRRPPAAPLPTARFVPGGDARAASRTSRPTDVLLLLFRIFALALMGVAFAQPVARRGGVSLARVVILDRSRSARADVRDSAQSVIRSGDAIILADSAAHPLLGSGLDSVRALQSNGSEGSLSAALVAARRAARELSSRADSVELVIVSPFTRDEFDAATVPLTASWPGRVRVVRTQPAAAPNPIAARIVTVALSGADSAAARDGATVVHWPPLAANRPSAEGVWVRGTTLVALLGPRAIDATGVAIARWADGTPAVTEIAFGRGCIRDVGVGVPLVGDLTLRPAFIRFRNSITLGCGARTPAEAAPDSLVAMLTRGGAAASARAFAGSDESSPLAPWLIGAALLVLGAEWMLRRRKGVIA